MKKLTILVVGILIGLLVLFLMARGLGAGSEGEMHSRTNSFITWFTWTQTG